ncbi:MAG: KAP family NTPase [Nitrosomonadales bacterium]
MPELHDSNALIGSDAPQINPADDAFGYAPFAKRIADAICKAPSPQGLVMAIHGPWGSGKSTLLNYVKHNLCALPESDRPIVVDFNPWWFKGHDQLAGQFLAQFAAKLPHESEALRAIGDAMAEYSGAIGTVIMAAYPIPYLDKTVAWILKLFKRHVRDVPALKSEVAKALSDAGQRFVFVVDDIDRLAPDEIRELFKVVKALADFPNVIYLLAFDRDVVAASLNTSLGVDGEAYLEKIVQAPFALPSVDRQRLQRKLFADLDRVLSGTEESLFDATHWGNVYHDGLDQFIQKPRDIVRVMNVLSVTYPAVRGEVNPVDFIALEFLRIFLPEVYGTVRDHRDRFAGHSSESFRDDRTGVRAFHDGWLATVHETYREGVKAMVERLFPKLEGVWGNMNYSGDWEKRWRRDLRVCSPAVFSDLFSIWRLGR